MINYYYTPCSPRKNYSTPMKVPHSIYPEDMFIELEEVKPQYKYQKGRESETYKYYKLQEK